MLNAYLQMLHNNDFASSLISVSLAILAICVVIMIGSLIFRALGKYTMTNLGDEPSFIIPFGFSLIMAGINLITFISFAIDRWL